MSERALKVYGWLGYRRKQTREIVAAPSKAAVYRIVGQRNLFNLEETGNEEELTIALAEPGTVFWRGLDGREWAK